MLNSYPCGCTRDTRDAVSLQPFNSQTPYSNWSRERWHWLLTDDGKRRAEHTHLHLPCPQSGHLQDCCCPCLLS